MDWRKPLRKRRLIAALIEGPSVLRRTAVVLFAALTIAAAIPAAASAWTWGYNYMGPDANTNVTAGWNYWSSLYIDKRSGGRISYRFDNQSGGYCVNLVDGVTQVATSPQTACGYGGYIYLTFHYIYGSRSYVFLQAG